MEKKRAAFLSIASNSVIICLKIITGVISGSLSIISEAIHSSLDILASILTYFAVSRSGAPADKTHPYGYGKYEDLSGFIEGCLIVVAGLYILFEVIKKIITGYTVTFEPTLCIYVMAFAVISNIIVGNYILHVARKTDSIALYADSQHLRADVYSSFGVLCGFLLIKATGLVIIDAVIALFVANVILKTGINLVKKTVNNLLDGSLPAADITKIESILDENKLIRGYKDLKARQQGKCKNIEITLYFHPELNVKECHNICNEIEREIKEKLPTSSTMIHAEPYEK
ncbi:cation transporter [bacterium]|nr:cation transporter [bacterium]